MLQEQKKPGAAGSLSSWDLGAEGVRHDACWSLGPEGASVSAKHHHKLCGREGAGLGQVQVRDTHPLPPPRHWAQPGSQRNGVGWLAE